MLDNLITALRLWLAHQLVALEVWFLIGLVATAICGDGRYEKPFWKGVLNGWIAPFIWPRYFKQWREMRKEE